MTYRELIRFLQHLPEERLDDDVTIVDRTISEAFAVDECEVVDEEEESDDFGLDVGHAYLSFSP